MDDKQHSNADNAAFMNSEGKEWLVGVLRQHVAEIVFTKTTTGEERLMNCTLQESVVAPYEKKTDRVRVPSEDTLSVWDVDKNAWRSFKLYNIKSVRFNIE